MNLGRKEGGSKHGREIGLPIVNKPNPHVSEEARVKDVAPWKRMTVSVQMQLERLMWGTVLPLWARGRLLLWSLTTAELWKPVTVPWPLASDSSLARPRYPGCSIAFLGAVSPRKMRGTVNALFKSEQRMLPALMQKVILEFSPSWAARRAAFPEQHFPSSSPSPEQWIRVLEGWSSGEHTCLGKALSQMHPQRFSAAVSLSKHSQVSESKTKMHLFCFQVPSLFIYLNLTTCTGWWR